MYWNLSDEDEVSDISGGDQGKRVSTGTSWGSNRLPPSVTGPKSVSPLKKSPEKSPASSKSNTPDSSPLKVNILEILFFYDFFLVKSDMHEFLETFFLNWSIIK